jgi:hypothetical protein
MGDVQEFKNRKTIIIGEVNTGKTAYLGKILDMFLREEKTTIAVIDMAPNAIKGIGGKMRAEGIEPSRYYTAPIVAPRLMGKNVDEVENLAARNASLINDIIEKYLNSPVEVLFINDVSLFLQAGNIDKLFSLFNSTPTLIMNGYYGNSLGGGELGMREKWNMETLMKRCDRVIKLIKMPII